MIFLRHQDTIILLIFISFFFLREGKLKLKLWYIIIQKGFVRPQKLAG